jgi:hypothetical protein
VSDGGVRLVRTEAGDIVPVPGLHDFDYRSLGKPGRVCCIVA